MLEEVGDTSMRRGVLVILSACLIIAGCAAPMTMREIRAVNPNCARISKQIALLEKEKAQNNYRILAGIQTVAPALAVLNLWRVGTVRTSRLPRGNGDKLSTESSSN